MTTNTLTIDGLSPARRRADHDEGVIFERKTNGQESAAQSTIVDIKSPASLRPRVSAGVDNKLRTNHAKQRGWDIVAQARQNAKHQPRHKQRLAAQQAAHHHRQRQNIDNYAQVHAADLYLPGVKDNNQQSKMRFSARPLLRYSLATVSVAAFVFIVGAGALFMTQDDAATQPTMQTGQVQSATRQARPVEPSAVSPEADSTVDSGLKSVTDSGDDGNLELWSSLFAE